jgi:hypothetical protein
MVTGRGIRLFTDDEIARYERERERQRSAVA